jgi:membrane protease subunit HflC
MSRAVLSAVIVAALVLILVLLTAFQVRQTETALVLQFGEFKELVSQPGLHFKAPWQSVIKYDRRLLLYEAPPGRVNTADETFLDIAAYAQYRIVDPLQFYQTAGTVDAFRTRLGSIIGASFNGNIGQEKLQVVVSERRASIMRRIGDQVRAQAKRFGIDVVDVGIRYADYSQGNLKNRYDLMNAEFSRQATQFRAEGKRQADRIKAEADRNRIEILAEAQKQAQTLRGEGDADSIKIYADAFGRDKEFFAFYRSLQAYRDSLSGEGTTLVLSPESEFFKYLEAGPSGAASAGVAPAAPR